MNSNDFTVLQNKYSLFYSEEVKKALINNLPIVALESTIITHGMEYPTNLTTAQSVEEIIRSHNAVPATIAIIKGEIKVGLSKEELEFVAQNTTQFRKATTRDIASILIKKQNGSTTVAATMFIANLAGLKVFVTGGIGGVHMDVAETWDISADLLELSRTPVTVICAGAKSILDIPKTLEYLETNSVTVVGLRTNKFPEFYFSEGDCDVPMVLDNEEECAELIYKTHNCLEMKNGILIGNPVPKEVQVDKSVIKGAIKEALKLCKENNISGQNVTPFLLKEVCKLTKGESASINVELIRNNAKVGAKIAIALYKLVSSK
jgi:pseudouridine-5'-phosphate glycosidase